MYSFSSFFSRFQSLNQAKTEVAAAKEDSNIETATTNPDMTVKNRAIFEPNLRSLGTSDKFYTPFFRPPTTIHNYVKELMSGPKDYTQTKAYQRAFAGYKTGGMFSGAVSRIGNLTNLFDSAIQNPFGVSKDT